MRRRGMPVAREVRRPRVRTAEAQALARDSLEGHHDDAGEDQTVFAQLGLRPVHSTIATQALDESRRAVAALQAESAVDFDRTFVDQQVELDRWAAKALDAVIGKVGTLQLRRLFERHRAAVAGHLRKAEELQKRMPPPTQ